jgi:hypothetical protein
MDVSVAWSFLSSYGVNMLAVLLVVVFYLFFLIL